MGEEKVYLLLLIFATIISIILLYSQEDESLEHIEIPIKYHSEISKKWIVYYKENLEYWLYYDTEFNRFRFMLNAEHCEEYKTKEDAQYDLRKYLLQESEKLSLKNSYKSKNEN